MAEKADKSRSKPDAPESLADVIGQALRAGHERLVTAMESVPQSEPDSVHQVRVAARGLRSDLRVFRDLLDPAWVGHLRDELSWLASACGPARDLEVVLEWLDDVPADVGMPLEAPDVAQVRGAIAAKQQAAEAVARAATESERASSLVAYLAAGAEDPPVTGEAARPARDVLEPLIRKAWRRYAKPARGLVVDVDPAVPESLDAAWHEVRVRAKRARYAAHSAAGVLSSGGVEEAAKAAQTHLGEHQDRVVAATVLAEVGAEADAPTVAFAAGRLAEMARQELPAIRASMKRPKKRPPGLSR